MRSKREGPLKTAAPQAPAAGGKEKAPPEPVWSLYILECQDGSFYTGIARDPFKRFEAHCRGKGAAYTRMHPPRALRLVERVGSRGDALRREWQVKHWTRAAKVRFINDRSRRSLLLSPRLTRSMR